MKNMNTAIVTASIIGAATSVASASMTATITADNHYAVYAEQEGALSFIGANETGAGGSPGTYNWSMAETWDLTGATSVYIAAWSDDRVAQGLLASFDLGGDDPILSGDGGWLVFGTGIGKGDGDAAPSVAEMATQIGIADAGELWETPYVGDANAPSAGPWGKIAGVADDARWMWRSTGDERNALIGGADHGEYLIFKRAIPTPGTTILAAAGGLAFLGRRRKG